MGKLKKWIVIGAAIIFIAAFLFMLIVNAISATLTAVLQHGRNSEYTETMVCSITGTKTGNDLDLILNYDSFTVTGITGTVSTSGKTFAASTKNKNTNQKTKLALPSSGADLNVQTFMSYTAVTAQNSSQYKLLNSDSAKDAGIYRKVNGYYAVALGSFYGTKIGTKYLITFQQPDGSTKTIKAILGDQKSDEHTDANKQYHVTDKSVVEFITAKGTADNVSATQTKINGDFGTLTGIYRLGGTDVILKGTISGSEISITGTVDGVKMIANGTIANNKINAEGFIGDSENFMTDEGIYSGGEFTWPVPGNTYVSSDYGPRICPFHGKEVHSGIDIPASSGTPIVAATNGKVVLSSYNGSYGKCIILSHGSGLFTLYGHCSKLQVNEGEAVTKGQVIAKVGSTGNSTGPHLHFEVRKGGNLYRNHTSPWGYVKKIIN